MIPALGLLNTVGEVVVIEKEPAGDYVKLVIEHNAENAAGLMLRWHTTTYVPIIQAKLYRVGQRVRFSVVNDEGKAFGNA